MEMSDIFSPLTDADWWEGVAEKFISVLRRHKHERICLLYNADADGFAASYFALGIIDSLSRPQPANVQTRAVWNYEYDFSWLPAFVADNSPAVIISVDIPIIQEPEVLQKISDTCEILIYDHHIPPERIDPIPQVFYANSHLLEAKDTDYPASFFAAALAFSINGTTQVDIPVLACGLCCDNCLFTNKKMTKFLWQIFPALMDAPADARPPLKRLTARLNALFRANPDQTPADAQRDLYMLLRSLPAQDAFIQFCRQYNLDNAQWHITQEVQPALKLFQAKAPSDDGLLCEVLDFKTCSTGIVASVLAAQNHCPVVALGFEIADKVHFDLRSNRDNSIDLTKLLKAQRAYFAPITSGGHPKAAGALIHSKDIQKFRTSLQKAVTQSL
ncbi:MAG: DHH family phosphoesterase [Planctomycetota bacterium]|jgi:hypothetical protein